MKGKRAFEITRAATAVCEGIAISDAGDVAALVADEPAAVAGQYGSASSVVWIDAKTGVIKASHATGSDRNEIGRASCRERVYGTV